MSLLPPIGATQAARLRDACGSEPGSICERAFDWTGEPTVAKVADFALGKPLTILAILVGAFIVNRIVRRSIKRTLRRLQAGGLKEKLGAVRDRTPSALLETEELSLRAEQRLEALVTVLRSVASFAIGVLAVFLVLGEMGIELGPLLAGAGILGVALGFGSQSLVKDFLSGLFILIEDQFGVGDIVDVGEASGTVEAVSLRTTRLRAVDGTVWHVPNGEIRRVGNMSQHWSRALLDVPIPYSADIARAREVIKTVADDVWREDRNVLEEPELWGVERFAPDGPVIRLVVKTRPSEQWAVSRELRERIKVALEREGMEIPVPQQVVWNRFEPGFARAGARGEDGSDAGGDDD